jgi:proline-rich protein PRCC
VGKDRTSPSLSSLKDDLTPSSALLGMLPPPKRKLPASNSSVSKPIVPKVALPKPAANLPAPPGLNQVNSDSDDEGMVPASVRRKEKEKASVDLFGLGQFSTLDSL